MVGRVHFSWLQILASIHYMFQKEEERNGYPQLQTLAQVRRFSCALLVLCCRCVRLLSSSLILCLANVLDCAPVGWLWSRSCQGVGNRKHLRKSTDGSGRLRLHGRVSRHLGSSGPGARSAGTHDVHRRKRKGSGENSPVTVSTCSKISVISVSTHQVKAANTVAALAALQMLP